ncbi:hypothetical protein M8998_00340 [Sphingobacterium sp. lm-10]|uniref:hypothetical protein n=1 Tax=Sphingobacterium sp. lm-10 TaxID=2944904 RepID=UPI0020201955|nr:hypothetical protein [Sphingobacterium sp. lm-10]MCL7986380.1 hypothetical protein [Sphingobacterium sp. lm-10]
MSLLPESFEEWKICIEKKCGIPLTLEFAEKRLAVYADENLPETKRFAKLYGDQHLSNIKLWLSIIIGRNKNQELDNKNGKG